MYKDHRLCTLNLLSKFYWYDKYQMFINSIFEYFKIRKMEYIVLHYDDISLLCMYSIDNFVHIIAIQDKISYILYMSKDEKDQIYNYLRCDMSTIWGN